MNKLSKTDIDLIIYYKREDLNHLINHHNFIHRLLGVEYQKMLGDKNEQTQLTQHDKLNTKNTFLLMYALFEELIVIISSAYTISTINNCNDFFKKHQEVFKSLKMEPSYSDYNKLKNISKLRHLLMHCNSNFSLYKRNDKKQLEKFLSEKNLLLRNHFIIISKEFVHEFSLIISLILDRAQTLNQ